MSRLSITGLVLACLLAGEPALAQGAPVSPSRKSVKLSQVIMALPVGAPWLSFHVDTLLCIYHPVNASWSGARERLKISPYVPPFKAELEKAGYQVTDSVDDLFDEQTGASDYQVAAVITDAHFEGCISNGAYFTESGSVRGSGSMKIDWQVYSPLKRQVVARVSTSGTSRLENSVVGGVQRLIVDAFASNARELASSADFRAAVTAAGVAPGAILPSGTQDKIVLAGSLKAAKRPIADMVGSVVTILTGSGSGSGDLVSADGYILTNAHVVGDEKSVRVRWSDGLETAAEVVRVAKTRDVALIKTNPRDREPLPIKRGPVTPGQRVFAIGSPLGKQYEGTVSSGIVSAVRVMEGMRYIQSDVSITHGSSGGALLDENGAMIGITVSTVEVGGPVGINFFIPIGDAMDFLALEQQ